MAILPLEDFLQKHRPAYEKRYGPLALIDQLKEGDVVNKSSGLDYEIDDIKKVLSKIGESKDFPYGKINGMLRSDAEAIKALFDAEGQTRKGKKVLPFSRVVEEGLGECLEKSVLSHLFLQNFPQVHEHFLVSGNIGSDDGEVGYHSFNLAKRNGNWVVIDTENPHEKKNGKVIPYIVPIQGVQASNDLPLKLDETRRNKRKYFLRL
ncbi:MAG: hypothetical protein KJ879_00150 [Nanoarchaeota archaeon]|nr:hypothetical protein [Nanoarchaeota archaeon]